MPERNGVAKIDYGSAEDDDQIGWVFGLLFGVLFTPCMIARFLLRPKYREIEKVTLNAVREALPPSLVSIFDSQMRGVNFVQLGASRNTLEATFFRWNFVSMQGGKQPKLPCLGNHTVLLATVTLKVDNQIFTAELLSLEGVVSYIFFTPDAYDFRKRDDIVVVDVDAEPVAIDGKGKFIGFV